MGSGWPEAPWADRGWRGAPGDGRDGERRARARPPSSPSGRREPCTPAPKARRTRLLRLPPRLRSQKGGKDEVEMLGVTRPASKRRSGREALGSGGPSGGPRPSPPSSRHFVDHRPHTEPLGYRGYRTGGPTSPFRKKGEESRPSWKDRSLSWGSDKTGTGPWIPCTSQTEGRH